MLFTVLFDHLELHHEIIDSSQWKIQCKKTPIYEKLKYILVQDPSTPIIILLRYSTHIIVWNIIVPLQLKHLSLKRDCDTSVHFTAVI